MEKKQTGNSNYIDNSLNNDVQLTESMLLEDDKLDNILVTDIKYDEHALTTNGYNHIEDDYQATNNNIPIAKSYNRKVKEETNFLGQ